VAPLRLCLGKHFFPFFKCCTVVIDTKNFRKTFNSRMDSTLINFLTLPVDGARFEALVAQLMEAMGYTILEKPAIGTEGGRDILVERTLKDVMGERRERVVVQCKHHAHSGKAISDRELGVWQSALTRHKARGYLLVTDVRVTENVSRAFREFTNDEANYPKWAAFWDVDTLTSHLYRHSSIKDAFFPKSSDRHADHMELADEVHSWLQAVNYDVGMPTVVNERSIELAVSVQHPVASKSVRVRCVDGELNLSDAENFYQYLNTQSASGWIISETRVSDRARQFALKHRVIEVLNFADFIEKVIWRPYFTALRKSISEQKLDDLYVDPSCYKIEVGDNGEEKGRDLFKSLDDYIDRWVHERGASQLALLSDFGGGKTWFCLHYAHRQLMRFLDSPLSERVPLYLPLRAFRDMSAANLITSALVDHCHIPVIGNAHAIFERLSAQGKLLLLLDGFDEFSRRVDRASLLEMWSEISKLATGKNKLIITSRNEFFRYAKETEMFFNAAREKMPESSPRFEALYISPLTNDQVQNAILKRTGIDRAAELATLFSRAPQLAAMARKPVVIQLLTEFARSDVSHVRSLAEIYAYSTNKLLVRNILSGNTFLTNTAKLLFLAELAWDMVTTGNFSIHYSAFPEAILQSFSLKLKSNEDDDIWDADLRNQTVLHRDPAGYYQFAHRSLAEYFAAFKLAAEIGIEPTLVRTYDGVHISELTRKLRPAKSRPAFGKMALTSDRLRTVTQFLKQMLSKASLRRLNSLLMEDTCDDFSQSNAATLLVAKGISLEKRELSKKNLAAADLTGGDFRGATCAGLVCRGADISEAYLSDADFRGADLSGVRMEHVSGIKSIQFFMSQNRVISASSDGLVEIWDVAKQRRTGGFKAHPPSSMIDVRLMKDERYCITGGRDGRLAKWDLQSGQAVSEMRTEGAVHSIEIDSKRNLLAAVHWDVRRVVILNLSTRNVINEFDLPEKEVGYDTRFSPDGNYLVVAHSGGGARIWDIVRGKPVGDVGGHASKVESICFVDEGRYLVTGGYDRLLRVWDTRSWRLVREGRDEAMIAHLAAHLKGKLLFTALHNGCVGVWDWTVMKRVRLIRCHKGSTYVVNISDDAELIVSGGQDATIQIHEVASFKKVASFAQALRCDGLLLRGVKGLKPHLKSILRARGASG